MAAHGQQHTGMVEYSTRHRRGERQRERPQRREPRRNEPTHGGATMSSDGRGCTTSRAGRCGDTKRWRAESCGVSGAGVTAVCRMATGIDCANTCERGKKGRDRTPRARTECRCENVCGADSGRREPRTSEERGRDDVYDVLWQTRMPRDRANQNPRTAFLRLQAKSGLQARGTGYNGKDAK